MSAGFSESWFYGNIKKEPALLNSYINEDNDHPALCLAAHYGHTKIAKLLIDMECNINILYY